MEREGRNDVIGIRVAPVVRGRCIVDGQNLDDLHTCDHSPVDKALQITEIAYAIRTLCSQREDRNGHTCSTPGMFFYPEVFAISHQHGSIRHRILVWRQQSISSTVIAFLPSEQGVSLIIDNHIFIFDGQQYRIDIHRQQPVVTTHMFHLEVSGRIPTADSRMVADKG